MSELPEVPDLTDELQSDEVPDLYSEDVHDDVYDLAAVPVHTDAAHRNGVRGELIKFAILSAVLLATILVVASARPLIFGQIVPAILGDGVPTAPMPLGTDAQPLKEDPALDEAEAVESAPDAAGEENNAEVFIPAVTEGSPAEAGEGEAGAETAVDPDDNTIFIPAVSEGDTSLLVHTVQPGETLIGIAETYSTTVEVIMETNEIFNPNLITAGDVIRVPQPDAQP